MCSPADWLGLGKLCAPPSRNRLRANSRMLKKTASIVLASLRGSTYRSVRLATSLTAALLGGLFEHPEIIEAFVPSVRFQRCLM